jgi:hypothetical protein
LHHSTDYGATFNTVAGTSAVADVSFGKALNDGAYPAVYISGTANNVAGIFRSDDGGAQFSRIDDDKHQFGYINHIAADPRKYGRVYLGSGGRGILYGDIR